MVVGVYKVSLHMEGNNELKYKRRIIQKIRERVRSKFNAAVAQVDTHSESHTYAEIGIAIVGNDEQFVSSQLQKVKDFVGGLSLVRLGSEESDLFSYE